jgi:hypothetical protein
MILEDEKPGGTYRKYVEARMKRRLSSDRSKKNKTRGQRRKRVPVQTGKNRNPDIDSQKPNYGFVDPERTDDKAEGDEETRYAQGEFQNDNRDIQSSSDKDIETSKGRTDEISGEEVIDTESDVVARGKSADVEGGTEDEVEPINPEETDVKRRDRRDRQQGDYTPE